MRRLLGAALAAGALLAAGAPARAADAPVTIRGRVTDAAGRGVPGVGIRVVESRRDFKISDWRFEDHLRKRSLARTDADGFFEAAFTPDAGYHGFWLRFYDASSFDAVRYGIPPDRDIADRVRARRDVVETVTLEDAPQWAEVEVSIREFGEGSPRASLVRQIGLPDRRDEVDGVERFWYSQLGKVYRFRDGEFLGEEPAPATDGDAPEPGE
jgi:hypothetical protein